MPRYIDADALKDDIAVLFERNEKLIDEWLANCVDDVIDEQPSADVVERKMGKWIKHKDRTCWYCSECNTDNYYAYAWNSDTGKHEFQDNYCPNCGAKMEESDG